MPAETARQTQARLLEVIAHAHFEVLPELYAFVPLAPDAKVRDDALARVRDGAVWCELVPIFDYWGCPADAADRVLGEVRALIARGRRPRRAHVGPRR